MDNNGIALARAILGLFAPCALLLGLAMAGNPVLFWEVLGVAIHEGAVVGILYGSVLVGVGAVSLVAWHDPARHATLLLFIGTYKAVVVLGLVWYGWQHALPVIAWAIAVLYTVLAALCVWLYARLAAMGAEEAGYG